MIKLNDRALTCFCNCLTEFATGDRELGKPNLSIICLNFCLSYNAIKLKEIKLDEQLGINTSYKALNTCTILDKNSTLADAYRGGFYNDDKEIKEIDVISNKETIKAIPKNLFFLKP